MTPRGPNKPLFSALLQTQHLFQLLRVTEAVRRIPLAYAAYCYLYRQLAPQDDLFIDVFGNRLFLDPQDLGMCRALLLAHGQWEPAETQVVRSLIRDATTFVDIGANIGYYTLLAAQLVGPQGRVVAFEPCPSNLSILRRNIDFNRYRNITVVSNAVSNSSGIARLEVDPESSGTHRLSVPTASRNSISVETVSLDDYFAGSDTQIDFIKLDAEGAEPLILAGMKQIIKGSSNLVLLTEFSPVAIRAMGHSPRAFLNDLGASGFEIRPITGSGLSACSLTRNQIAELASSPVSTNLLCIGDQCVLQTRRCAP